MDIAIIGTGYVGLVAGACFAESGNDVICVDIDEAKVRALREGRIPIYEPGLEELVRRHAPTGRLRFTTDITDAVQSCNVVFIAVGTPQDEDGSADLTHVLAAACAIGRAMNGPQIVVDKSTVPVGTHRLVAQAIREVTHHPVTVVSNPEFLKEGNAIEDFLKPDRVVIGTADEEARRVMTELYEPFVRTGKPILFMDEASAEMAKYAANSLLAAKVTFMNEIALLCEAMGADVNRVREGVGTDSRIGPSFLFAGVGYGGSCFPKDVSALARMGRDNGIELRIVEATQKANDRQKKIILAKIDGEMGNDLSGRTIAVWGLSFKPKTDDMRDAPSLTIVRGLLDRGARVVAHDPQAHHEARRLFGEAIELVEDPYLALRGAHALVLLTEWSIFSHPDFDRMKSDMAALLVFDGRNIWNPSRMRKLGFIYHSIGRVTVRPG